MQTATPLALAGAQGAAISTSVVVRTQVLSACSTGSSESVPSSASSSTQLIAVAAGLGVPLGFVLAASLAWLLYHCGKRSSREVGGAYGTPITHEHGVAQVQSPGFVHKAELQGGQVANRKAVAQPLQGAIVGLGSRDNYRSELEHEQPVTHELPH